MGLREELQKAGDWMSRGAACDPACRIDVVPVVGEAPEEEVNEGESAALDDFLRVYPPGYVRKEAIDGERAPLLLSIVRHRRVPINWWAAIDDETTRFSSLVDATREQIETRWLLEAQDSGDIPADAIVRDRALHVRSLALSNLGTDASFIKDGPIPNNSVIVAEGQHKNTRLFAVEMASDANLQAPRWVDALSAVEVFENSAEKEPGFDELVAGLRSLVVGHFDERLVDPIALPQLSSRVTIPALCARVFCGWRSKLISGSLQANLVRVTGGGSPSAEKYWVLNEGKRKAAFTDTKAPPEWASEQEEKFLDPLVDVLQSVGEGPSGNAPFAWVIKCGGRRYRLALREDLNASDKARDLTKFEHYDWAWKEAIVGLEPIAWSQNPAATKPDWVPFSYLESVDLSPQLIVSEFARLKSELDISRSTSSLGDELLKKIPGMTDISPSDVNSAVQNVRDYKSASFIAEWRIRTLKDRAARLGYHLATGLSDAEGNLDNVIKVPVGPNKTEDKTMAVGRLYVTEERVATYTVMRSQLGNISLSGPVGLMSGVLSPVLNPVGGVAGALTSAVGGVISGALSSVPVVGSLFGRRKRRNYPVQVAVRYTGLREVPIATEPWELKREQLENAGFRCIFAELTDHGYAATGGVPLRELLGRAQVDEEYRQKLAVFLPIHQERLDEGLVKVRYLIAIRPEPGIEPTGFPTVYCEEQLSYHAEWRGVELGELLHSVSLAPGEERNVRITRTIEQKTERVESITSVLDVTQSQRMDLQTSLQNTIQREKTSKTASNWNANASFSVGGFGGGGGGGGSQETTVRDFAETIRKSALQTTKEMRVQQRQEVRSSVTSSTAVITTESTDTKFSNVNQGRTLNLLFYQVGNVFDAGLFLNKLKIAYKPSIELVQGSGVYDILSYELKDLSRFVDNVCGDQALANGEFLFDISTLERRLLRSVVRTIADDYISSSGVEGQRVADEVLIDGDGAEREDVLSLLGAVADGEHVAEEVRRYVAFLSKLDNRGQVLEPHTLVVPSTATYADAVVGAVPSTEPYSERMREVEIELRKADAEDRRGAAALKRATSMACGGGDRDWVVEQVELDRQFGRHLRVRISPPLPAGRWSVVSDGEFLANFDLAAESSVVDLGAPKDRPWPTDSRRSWCLVHANGRDFVALPIV